MAIMYIALWCLIQGIENKQGVIAGVRDWLDEGISIHTDDPSAVIESMHTTSYGMVGCVCKENLRVISKPEGFITAINQ